METNYTFNNFLTFWRWK